LHGRHVIGVNNAYMIGSWLDMVFFGDCSWYLVHRQNLAKWPKLKITCCSRFINRSVMESEGVKFLAKNNSKPYGISRDPTTVSWNNNSGAAAISLAANLGVKRIVLLGYDMRADDHKASHWHKGHHIGNHPRGNRMPPFDRHLKGFPIIASDAKALGIEILNASPTSRITEFPKVTAKEILQDENNSSSVNGVEEAVGNIVSGTACACCGAGPGEGSVQHDLRGAIG
jgi:hypothetical protein